MKLEQLGSEIASIHRKERKFNVGSRARIKARRILEGKTLSQISDGIASNGAPVVHGLTEAQRKRIERRLRKPSPKAEEIFWGLRGHRLGLRIEARATQIAYGFLKGMAYSRIEPSAKTSPNWKKVEDMVKKYGEGDVTERMARFDEWRNPAKDEAKAA